MHCLAGIIVTPKSKPLDRRMNRFCDYWGEGKPHAFCDGYATLSIDKKGVLHPFYTDVEAEPYCEALGSYRVREMENLRGHRYSATLTTLVTPSDKVLEVEDTDIESVLKKYCEKHPDWGIRIIQ